MARHFYFAFVVHFNLIYFNFGLFYLILTFLASGWYSEGINVMYCELVPSLVAIFSFMSKNRV